MSIDASLPAAEAAILSRVIDPGSPTLGPEAARSLLGLDFNAEDRARIGELSQKANEGTLTAEERAQIEGYNHVGHLIALLQSKARLSLKKAGLSS